MIYDKLIATAVLVFASIVSLNIQPTAINVGDDIMEPPSIELLVGFDSMLHQQQEKNVFKQSPDIIVHTKSKNPIEHYGIVFKHGDISWLPQLASQAGWPEDTWHQLGQIILRESGGCPNRKGGDQVNSNCRITNVSEWNHRSDTGLTQINGVNYNMKRNRWAAVCLQIDVCTQEPLLDPLVNLKAAKVLYDLLGWDPWDPCAWGPEYASRCKKSKKP